MEIRQRVLPVGTVLGGRYEVLQQLGEGSFSSVYRALDRSLSVECALKVLHQWANTDPQLVERFKREVLYSRRIVHEGCVQVFDFVEYGDVAVLVMELVTGWTLEELLGRVGTLPLPAACSLAAQAAAAIAVLHRNEVVHRDIKAQNMMVNREGRLKVLDLGLSWSTELSSLTAVGSVVGTPAYMAPEFIQDDDPTPHTDVYALGVLSYLLLTGCLPFDSPDLMKVLAMHVHQEPTPPRKLRPQISESVEALVLRCLRKDRTQRPADAGVLEEEWQTLLGGKPSRSVVAAVVEPLGEPRRDSSASPAAPSEPRRGLPPIAPPPASKDDPLNTGDSFVNLVLSVLGPEQAAAAQAAGGESASKPAAPAESAAKGSAAKGSAAKDPAAKDPAAKLPAGWSPAPREPAAKPAVPPVQPPPTRPRDDVPITEMLPPMKFEPPAAKQPAAQEPARDDEPITELMQPPKLQPPEPPPAAAKPAAKPAAKLPAASPKASVDPTHVLDFPALQAQLKAASPPPAAPSVPPRAPLAPPAARGTPILPPQDDADHDDEGEVTLSRDAQWAAATPGRGRLLRWLLLLVFFLLLAAGGVVLFALRRAGKIELPF